MRGTNQIFEQLGREKKYEGGGVTQEDSSLHRPSETWRNVDSRLHRGVGVTGKRASSAHMVLTQKWRSVGQLVGGASSNTSTARYSVGPDSPTC